MHHELSSIATFAAALGIANGASALFGVSFALGVFFAGMILRESALCHRAANESLPLRDAFAVLVSIASNPLLVAAVEPLPRWIKRRSRCPRRPFRHKHRANARAAWQTCSCRRPEGPVRRRRGHSPCIAEETAMRLTRISRAIGLAIVLAPGLAFAITDDETNTGLQFNFSNPGARSLALGGAFTGLADDATAVYANPAGLTSLRAQEFSFEVRHTGFDTPYTDGGVARSSPYDGSGLSEGQSSDSVSAVSFASWVVPLEKATIALYYHRLADFEGRFDSDTVEFVDSAGQSLTLFNSRTADIEYSVENLGAGIGYRAADNFSIGLTVAYSDFQLDSGAVRSSQGVARNRQSQQGDDHDIVYTLGALWQINSKWNLGFAYRAGGDFDYAASNESVADPNVRIDKIANFDLPNVVSLGLAFRPNDNWLITLDANRVEYSQLSDGLVSIFPTAGVVQAPPLEFPDGTEIRLGAEYAFLDMTNPLFLRGGLWRDPDHRLGFVGALPADCESDGFLLCGGAAFFPQGDDELHYSLGFGWVISKFQLDFAADLSDAVDTYAVSGVYRF